MALKEDLQNCLYKIIRTDPFSGALLQEMTFKFDNQNIPTAAIYFNQKTAKFENAEVLTIDGLRVEYADGFGLMRPSNTTPVIVLRFEADNEEALARIQNDFRNVILAAAPEAKLPF